MTFPFWNFTICIVYYTLPLYFLQKFFLVFFCDSRLLYTLVRGYCHTFDVLTKSKTK